MECCECAADSEDSEDPEDSEEEDSEEEEEEECNGRSNVIGCCAKHAADHMYVAYQKHRQSDHDKYGALDPKVHSSGSLLVSAPSLGILNESLETAPSPEDLQLQQCIAEELKLQQIVGEFRDEDNGSLLVAAPCLDGMPHADLQLQQEVVEEDLKRDGGLFVGDLCILADGKVA